MAVATKVDLERLSRDLFRHFDALEFDKVRAMMDVTIQGVDEISRGWRRGKDAIAGYFEDVAALGIANVSSMLSDFHAETIGDLGVVTFGVDQTYDLEGVTHRIEAPTTLVLRKRGDDWCIALVHSVALPAAE